MARQKSTKPFPTEIPRARKTAVSSLPTARALLRENPYATPRNLANHLIHHSPVLTELVITREWLQDTAPPPQIIESAAAYWNFTRLSLMHIQRSGVAGTQANLVKELDPDVLSRDPNSALTAEDAVSAFIARSILFVLSLGIRHTKRRWPIPYTLISVLAKANKRWTFVAPHIDHGVLQLCKVINYSTGPLYVRLPLV